MGRYIALLRAVNVGGTGKLPMADLKAMCVGADFAEVETYIASGNVVFTSPSDAASAASILQSMLLEYAGKPIGVIVRSAREMADILNANPYPSHDPKHTYVLFLDAPPTQNALDTVTGQDGEEMRLGKREIYIAYPNGMGSSKLKIPAGKTGTARNLNTVRALVEIAA